MKAVAYLRTSTLKEEDSISQNVQLEKITTFASERGIDIVQSFYDNNVSGATIIREQMEALKSYVKTHQIKKVIVYKLDRLARSLEASLFLEKELLVIGAEVMYATQDMLNGDGAMISLFKNIIASFADFERQMIIERTTHGKVQKLKKQRDSKEIKSYADASIGGVKPYGMGSGDTEIAKQIFLLSSKGMNQSEIADRLNANNIPSPRGGVWKQPTVRYILKNKKYHGIYESNFNGEKIVNKVASIF